MKRTPLYFIAFLFSYPLVAQHSNLIQLDFLQTAGLIPSGYAFTQDTVISPFDQSEFDWEPADRQTIRRKERGIHWHRLDLLFEGEQNPEDLLALRFFNLPMAFEVYWDGELLGKNGKTGLDSASEIPGEVNRVFPLPQSFTRPGPHRMHLKLSNYRWANHKAAPCFTTIGYLSAYRTLIQVLISEQMRQMSIFMLAVLICLILYAGGIKHPTLLHFGAYAFFGFLYYLHYHLIYTGHTGVHLYQYLETAWLFFPFRYLLLLLFVLHFYGMRWKNIYTLILGLPLLLVVDSGFLGDSILIPLIIRTIMLASLLVIAGGQRNKRVPGSSLLMAALMAQFVNYGVRYYTYFTKPSLYFAPRGVYQIMNLLFPGFIIVAIILMVTDQYRRFQLVSLKAKHMEEKIHRRDRKAQYIVYRVKNENCLIPVSHIRYFKAARHLVEVHHENGQTELVEKPLNRLEEILPDNFIRTHRSYIVNLDFTGSYRYTSGGLYEMHLKDGEILPVSRSRVHKLKILLKSKIPKPIPPSTSNS